MSAIINGTNGITFPTWTTGTRPASPAQGQAGYNTTIGAMETYTGSTWSTSDLPAPGTAGNVLTSNGTSWTSAAAAAFDAGTRLGFQQTAAPTGWTKDTTAAINDSMLRLVTGAASSGGSTAFSTWSAASSTSAYTLTTSDIPSHSHNMATKVSSGSSGGIMASSSGSGGFTNVSTDNTGGGGGHSHGLTRNLKYYDFIIASKN